MKFTTEQINAYGISATIKNYFHNKDKGYTVVSILFEGETETVGYYADPKMYFKEVIGKPMKVILNPKTKSLLYPNSESHPLPQSQQLPELPAELAELSFQPVKA